LFHQSSFCQRRCHPNLLLQASESLSLPSEIGAMPPNTEVMKVLDLDPAYVQRVSHRPKRTIEMVEPDPKWPSSFVLIAQRIQAALGSRALSIEHVGSTSVPDLPAKDVIDVDLVVADPKDESDYVQDLEGAGFQFLSRQPEVISSIWTVKRSQVLTPIRAVVRASLLRP
jgi:hypothetical protein